MLYASVGASSSRIRRVTLRPLRRFVLRPFSIWSSTEAPPCTVGTKCSSTTTPSTPQTSRAAPCSAFASRLADCHGAATTRHQPQNSRDRVDNGTLDHLRPRGRPRRAASRRAISRLTNAVVLGRIEVEASMVTRLGGLVVLCAVLGGCTLGHADLVRRDQYGGILALRGHQGEAMQDARNQMAAHCGGAYSIVSEENAVVGEQTHSAGEENYDRYGTYGSTSTETTPVTEYRVTYQCGGGAPPPQAPPGALMSEPPPAGGAPAQSAPPPPPPPPQ